MLKKFKSLYFLFIFMVPLFFSSVSYGIPPKPGPQFVWIKPHTTENGAFIKGTGNILVHLEATRYG